MVRNSDFNEKFKEQVVKRESRFNEISSDINKHFDVNDQKFDIQNAKFNELSSSVNEVNIKLNEQKTGYRKLFL